MKKNIKLIFMIIPPNKKGDKVKKLRFSIAILVLIFTVSGAYPQEPIAVTAGGMDIVDDEVPAIEVPEESVPYVRPGHVTVNFNEADIRAVLNYLSEVSGVDIVTSPDVTGTVTLKLTDKPWDVALNIIVKNYGYAYEREGNIIRVVTVDSLKLAELSTEVIHLNYTSAEVGHAAVKDILTERGKMTFDARTNTLLITDLPTNIYKIKQVVSQIDKKTPQVMIEARIFETLLENDEKMGIDWTMKIAALGAKRPVTFPFSQFGTRNVFFRPAERFLPFGQTAGTTVTAGSGVASTQEPGEFPTSVDGQTYAFPFVDEASFTYGTLDFTQFQAVLELLRQRRRTEVISNPRITTLNNNEAKILVGRVYNFPIFDQAEDSGRWIISGYEAKELGIKLLVTPHVNDNNEIVVEIKPEISNFLGMEKISEELSAPLWSTREADTEVMVRDGDTIFIGGLVKENNIELDKKVPVLGDLFGDIPFIGGLVKHKAEDKEKTELVFFITVHIVKDMSSLTEIATRDLTDMVLPEEIIKKEEETVAADKEVHIELAVPTKKPAPKKHKPLFDFRKKKK